MLVFDWGHRGDTHTVGCTPTLGRGFETSLKWMVVLPVRNKGELPLHAPQHPSSLQISLDPPKCSQGGAAGAPAPKQDPHQALGFPQAAKGFLICFVPCLGSPQVGDQNLK